VTSHSICANVSKSTKVGPVLDLIETEMENGGSGPVLSPQATTAARRMTLTAAAISRICSSGYTWWRIVIRDLSHGRIIAGRARRA